MNPVPAQIKNSMLANMVVDKLPMKEAALKRRIGIELIILIVLTVVFLYVFPQRPIYVDAGLALFALLLIGLNWRFTRKVVWAQFPVDGEAPARFRQALKLTLLVTLLIAIVFLGTGIVIGYQQGGWAGAAKQIGNWHILLAIGIYFPWALLQQTLFQVYLLGRLLTLLPTATAITGTGIAYSLVHLPDPVLMLVTAGAGILWTWLYFRYRSLIPLALSHAFLGASFYYWIYGRDLYSSWQQFMP